MKRFSRATALLASAVLFGALPASAVPNLISYQGRLNDATGAPVSGTLSLTFRIYDVAAGGTPLWTESQTLNVSDGIFNVQLGAVAALPASLFVLDSLYVGVQVGADSEMAPRQRLTSAAFSQRAESLTSPIVPVGGIVPWLKSLPGTPALPTGWVECNGQVLSDPLSPFNAQIIPDLNGVSGPKRFLRGAVASGAVGGSETHTHTYPIFRSNSGSGSGAYTATGAGVTGSTETAPSYYEVVWIIRVR